MTDADKLQQTIRSTIPLSEAMQFQINHLDQQSIRVMAPLRPNINIHGTGFAGSIYGVGILTGWALCQHLINLSGVPAELVVGKADITYHSPVTGDLYCESFVDDSELQRLTDKLTAGRTAKLALQVEIGETPAATLQALFFAKPLSKN